MSDTRAAALRALLFASSAAGLMCAAPAVAEAPADEAPIATADQDTTNLGTIDVNGQRVKREPSSPEFVAPLVDTPRAVTVIPQQVIEQIGATSLQDLLRTSPGITFGAGEGGQPLADRPFIRGQSSGNNIFVDGIRDSGGQQREVFNLEQVEVIKGPDSVYSGRGSGGGSINLSSKTPKLTDFTNVSLGGGTDSYLRGTIDQNWRIGETAGFRINILGAQGDVAGRNAVDYDKFGVAAALGVGLGTDTTATLSFNYLDSNQMPDYGIPLYTKRGGATAPRENEEGILDVPYDTFYGLTARDYLTNTVTSATLRLEHRFSPNLAIRNITRYSETVNDYVVTNPGDGGAAQLINGVWWMKRGLKTRFNPVDTTANVTELFGSFNTGSIKHSFDLGAEFTHEVNNNSSWAVTTTGGTACPAPLTGFDCTPLYNPNPSDPWTGTILPGAVTKNSTKTKAVFAFDSIELSEQWLLNLGVRWDEYTTNGVTAAGVLVPETSWDFVNYQAGLVYKPTSNTSVYASWSTSSTPPTISAGDGNGSGGTGTGNLATTLLEPEETESYEIGAKASLFRDQLQLSAAAFALTRKNAQILVDVGTYAQAGEVEVKGIELGVSGNVTPQWQVFGGYTYQTSELVRGACTVDTTVTPNVCRPSLFEGDSLANTPEHNVSLFSTYKITPRITAGGGVYYVGKSFGGNQGGAGGGANKIYAPAYTRIDLFGSYALTDRATLQLNVQNAADEKYILRTNGVHHADPAPGRSATLALNVRF